jgi:hypothetical protein
MACRLRAELDPRETLIRASDAEHNAALRLARPQATLARKLAGDHRHPRLIKELPRDDAGAADACRLEAEDALRARVAREHSTPNADQQDPVVEPVD